MLLLIRPLFSFYSQKRSTKSDISGLIERFCKQNQERGCVSSNINNNFFSLFHKFKYCTERILWEFLPHLVW